MVWVAGSGVLLGLANLFLLAGATLSGAAVAFMLTFGVLLAGNTLWELSVNSDINLVLATSGVALAVVAAIVALIAYRWRLADQESAEAQALRADPRVKKNVVARPGTLSGPLLAILAGIILVLFFRTVANGISGDNGVAPYGALLLLSVGLVGSSIVIVPFFLYFPVRGGALQVRHYFKGNRTHHLLGLLGGILGGTAILAYMLARTAPPNLQPAPLVSYLLNYGAPVVAAVWGMSVWREFAGAVFRVNVIFFVSVVLLLAAIGITAASTL
jgi:glucose uptake protein